MAPLHRGNTTRDTLLKERYKLQEAVGVYIFDDFLLLPCGQDCCVTCAGSTCCAYVAPPFPLWLPPQRWTWVEWAFFFSFFLIKRLKKILQINTNEAKGCLTTFRTLLHSKTVVKSRGFHKGLFLFLFFSKRSCWTLTILLLRGPLPVASSTAPFKIRTCTAAPPGFFF